MSQMDCVRPMPGFAEFVQTVARDWHVPGLAVVILPTGEDPLIAAFGLRDVERSLPVTPQTLFAIGSCSKALCATSIAALVDAGVVRWEGLVRDYLPTFVMRDPFATQEMTIRDLLTHCCGLPRHDLVWLKSGRSRSELVQSLRYLQPSAGFRSVFQYSNLMYITAGHVVDRVTGRRWEEFVQRRLFAPLGMAASSTRIASSKDDADVALPYRRRQETTLRVEPLDPGSTGPAGGIQSTPQDLARWLAFHLLGGTCGQRQLVSAANLGESHRPQMAIRHWEGVTDLCQYSELGYPSYGMGWVVQPYRGHRLLWHGGNLEGFSAWVSFMPDDGLGVAVLTNMHNNPVGRIVALNAYDRLLGLEEVPWNERLRRQELELAAQAQSAKDRISTERRLGTRPTRPLTEYVGDYVHPAYGTFTVTLDEDELYAHFHTFSFVLRHYHFDIFLLDFARWDQWWRVEFRSDAWGRLDTVAVPMEPAVEPILFQRV